MTARPSTSRNGAWVLGRETLSCGALPRDDDDQVFWLKPRSAQKFRAEARTPTNVRPSGRGLLRLTMTAGFGVLLNLSSAETAFAPATARAAADFAGLDGITFASVLPVEAAPIPIPVDHNAPPSPESIGLRTQAAEPTDTALAKLMGDLNEDASASDGRDLMDFGAMKIPRRLVETILRAAQVTGVDPVYMMALADKESSFSVDVKARTSSAEGLFQFVAKTWLNVVREHGPKHGLDQDAAAIAMIDGEPVVTDDATRERILGLRRDPYLSALMAAEMLKCDRTKIERRIGRDLTRAEFYLAHFLGVDSAGRFVEILGGKPKQSARRVFPQAARANRTLFFTRKGRKMRDLTVAEVYARIDQMIDKRLDRYGSLGAVVRPVADAGQVDGAQVDGAQVDAGQANAGPMDTRAADARPLPVL